MKIGCAALAVAINATCIALVIRRKLLADRGGNEQAVWRTSDRVLLSFKLGFPLAAVAAGLGFYLAHERLADTLLKATAP